MRREVPCAESHIGAQRQSAVEVIKHSDGIPTAYSNPNRLTIVFSGDGTIAAAIWD
jgi:hypothetical protein